MQTKLARIAELAKEKPKEIFTSLYHMLNEELLMQCHEELEGKKATGIDGVTQAEYENDAQGNIRNLVERLKKKQYHPQAVRRVYIPKDNKSKRPLGIPAYEDKIVQRGLNKILQAIYEQDFLDTSYGFRPQRNCHDALRALNQALEQGKTNYVVDADIRSFFTDVNHEWLMKFVNQRVADPNIHRLIRRFLKAGVMEEGQWQATETGTPQGSNLSPLLSNVYLHYALDLWFEKVVKRACRGEAYMVRYADDYVCCFQYKEDAQGFYQALVPRLGKFDLTIAEEKTKIIEFGRYAAEDRQTKGEKKPETFDFLGFTHYCGKSMKGKFRVKRKTSKKKFNMKVKAFQEWLRGERHSEEKTLMKTVRQKLVGHYQYYGITDNSEMMGKFLLRIRRALFKWLNRRSQRKSFAYEKFEQFLARHRLPEPKIYVSIYG